MAEDHFYDHQHDGVEEDYIDMEISSTTYLCYTLPSPPHSHSIEFEFQMSSSSISTNPETDHIPSPADELFYKGNLLPLHLRPRLHMVETLLRSSPAPPDHPNTTPFESCNISPATSCYVSGELNAEEDYFFKEDCQEEDEEELVESRSKKSWCKKLKHSSIGLKLKASKAYLKSLFTKSGCSDETTSAVSKPKDCSGRYWKSSGGRKSPSPSPSPTPFGQQIQRIDGEKTDGEQCGHRRSFSGAIKRRSSSMNKSSSSSSSSCSSSNSSSFSSVNSNGPICVPQMLKRSSSVSSDKECSVQGAIAYCKKTQQQQQQQQVCARRSVSDVEFFLLSESSCRG